jgi:hypothetical protein
LCPQENEPLTTACATLCLPGWRHHDDEFYSTTS